MLKYLNCDVCIIVNYDNPVTRLFSAPSGQPEDVKNTSRTNTSLTFEWLQVACGQRGGPNSFNYELSDEKGNLLDYGSTPYLTVTINGLEPCTEYLFRVRAYNAGGNGQFSLPITWTTIGGKTCHF